MQKDLTAPFQSVRINLIAGESSLKAMATVKVHEMVFITGLKVIEGRKGLFVSMPSRKDNKGEYKDVCFPASKAMYAELQRVVMAAYKEALAQGEIPQAKEYVEDQAGELVAA
jgi:stage V sporulation protein G